MVLKMKGGWERGISLNGKKPICHPNSEWQTGGPTGEMVISLSVHSEY